MRSLRMTLAATALGAAGVLTAGALTASSPALAQGFPSTLIEHWGAYGSRDTQLSPQQLRLPGPVKEIGSSNSAQYALLTNGQVWAWGNGNQGQLGNGSTANSYTRAVQVQFPAGVTISYIPTDVDPYNSAFAVDTTGHVWAWGVNAGGEFCLGNDHEYLTPVELPLSDVTTLAGALDHATYDAGGTIYSCGINTYGDLGNGKTTSSRTAVKVRGLNGSQVTALEASWNNTGALMSDGTYYDWGYNQAGQVGNGDTSEVLVPYRVPLEAPVSQVALGGSFPNNGQTLALLSNGSLWAWGNDDSYQLGDGRNINETSPVQITPTDYQSYVALASGGGTCYAITRSGDVWAWGDNAQGEVGDGTKNTARQPEQVATNATQISATSEDVVIATSGL